MEGSKEHLKEDTSTANVSGVLEDSILKDKKTRKKSKKSKKTSPKRDETPQKSPEISSNASVTKIMIVPPVVYEEKDLKKNVFVNSDNL